MLHLKILTFSLGVTKNTTLPMSPTAQPIAGRTTHITQTLQDKTTDEEEVEAAIEAALEAEADMTQGPKANHVSTKCAQRMTTTTTVAI